MSTITPITPKPITVDFNIVIDASGNVDVFNALKPTVSNVIVAEHMLPVTDLYDPTQTIGLLELWEPSDAQGDIHVQLANTDCSLTGGLILTGAYQTAAKLLASSLQAILCDSFDCSGASPFNTYTANMEYYTQRNFGRIALATYAHYMFGHVDATAAITNDKTFVEGMLSISEGGDDDTIQGASLRAASWTKSVAQNVQTWNSSSSGTDANLAIRLVKALITKGLDTNGIPIVSSVNEPNQNTLRASLANIVAQVVGQDASRLMNMDNSQRTRDQHILLRFYAGDVIYMNITLKTPNISVGFRNQLVSESTLQSMYTEENFTLKITLTDGQSSEDPNILYQNAQRTVVTGYNGPVVGALTIPAPTEVIQTGAFVDQFLMTSLSLPYTLLEIEPAAFVNCTALESIIYPPTAEGVYESGFVGCGLLEPSMFQIDPNAATVPDSPTDINVTSENGQSTVSFTAPVNDGGSSITSYTVTSSPGNLQATGSSSPITMTGLINGTAYTFAVTATNSVGSSSSSMASSPVIPMTVPDAPTSISATGGNGQATVSFTAPTNTGGSTITSYTVTSSPGGLTATGSSSPITMTGLINGTAYTFTVMASNSVGSSASSTVSSPVTPIVPVTVPDAPTNVSATGGNSQATVSFTAPTNTGGSVITSYTVTSSPGGLTATGSSSPITMTGLTNGTAYTFTVTASNSVGNSLGSTVSSPVTPNNSTSPPSSSTIPYDPTITPRSFVWGANTAGITQNIMVVDSQQNVYITATSFSGAVIYNYSQINGTLVEQSEYGRIGDQTSGVYIRPLLLIKYNSSGQVQWVQLITQTVSNNDSSNILNQKLCIDKQDNIVFTCSYGYQGISTATLQTLMFQQQTGKDASNILTFTPVGRFTVQGSYDGVIAKYDTTGTPIWMTTISNGTVDTGEYITDVVTDSNSNIYISGHFGASTSLTTNTLKVFNSSPVPGTNTLITPTQFGQAQCPAANLRAGFIIKYDSNGQVQWMHMILGVNTTPLKGNGFYRNIFIDNSDNIIAQAWYQHIATTPLTNPIQTLNYTTTPLTYTQSLYLFDSILPGTPNIIQFRLFGQIPYINLNSVGAAIFMKFTPSGTVEWLNTIQMGGSSVTKPYMVDSKNNFYVGFRQQQTDILTYTYVSGLLENSVINLQPSGVQIMRASALVNNNSVTICKFNSNGTIVAVSSLYSPFTGLNAVNYTISCSQWDDMIISGQYEHASTTASQKSMYITNFVNQVNNKFDTSSALYGILPIVKDRDVFLIKYSSSGQGSWALNLNTGSTSATTLHENTNIMAVNGHYIYLGVTFLTAPLRLQTFTGIDSNSIIQQAGDIVMNYFDSTITGIPNIATNSALLKYSL
jgi:hypothetical protein